MKFQFEANQQYQLDAIQSVVGIFAGQQKNGDSRVSDRVELGIRGQQLSLESVNARANVLTLSQWQLIENVYRHQLKNDLPVSDEESFYIISTPGHDMRKNPRALKKGMNFSIEMETGTGKTYVYLRTIHELHQNYGWKKFIIVVPSVAIREGVLKNLEITKDHFAELYNEPEMNYYVWDSKKTGQAREFAMNDTLQIMVITIDSFAKAENIMNKESDYGRPLDFIKATHPIVILDEPQNMETEVRKAAIESLNPLCTLRYSATHKNPYNMLYRLTPVDAYDKGLVKKIEVHSVLSEDSYNDAYISIISIGRKNKSSLYAKVEVDKSDERGLQRQVVEVVPGTDLAKVTGRSIYEGYYVEAISHSDNVIELSNGKVLYVGQRDEAVHEAIVKRQIELTIEDHFEKQKRLNAENVKVLSLFFIDKVANYREYTEAGYVKGKFAEWFEDAYAKVAAKPRFTGVMDGLKAEEVHNGYFAADKTGNWKDSRDSKGEGGKTKDDDDAYGLIMRDKERLLDMNVPLRFIFSHSALREGWDNPNVFNICTLNETSSEMKKRQEIGRGLRLPVNANGERVRDGSINILTVIANESYDDFSRKLQTEIEEETGISFSGRIKNRDDRKKVLFTKSRALNPYFKELWNKIKLKTTYHVSINTEELINEAVRQLEEVTSSIQPPKLTDKRTLLVEMGDEFKTRDELGGNRVIHNEIERIPNVLEAVQRRTFMTRKLIFDILDKANMFDVIPTNPQQVIDEVSKIINRVKLQSAVDGIKYEKTGEEYDMQLFENRELEAYLYDAMSHSGAVTVTELDKTVYDYVPVDSEIEHEFMQSLENSNSVKFYLKLPGWFKIDTPVGGYNPDWAIVLEKDEKVYFVAETKDTNDLFDGSLRTGEIARILSGRAHFEAMNVPYFAPVNSLSSIVYKLGEKSD